MEVDRTTLVRLPHLHDDPESPPDLPSALTDAHAALFKTANDAAAQAATISADPRWSESERTRLLGELAESVLPDIANAGEVADAVERLADEHAASTLRRAFAKFDGARLLAVATSLASRTKEQKLSALIRARNNGDLETLAAIASAPREIGFADDFDERVFDMLHDRLIDSVDPKVREAVASTKFAASRMRVAIGTAEAGVRRATKTEAPMADRIRQSA